MKIELILGGEKKSSSHVCYFHDKSKKYYRAGSSLPWGCLEEKKWKHMGWICKKFEKMSCLCQGWTKTVLVNYAETF